MADVRCGSCGEDVPEGAFCVRCGAHLGPDPAAASPSRGRSAFAAAPHQALNVPWLVASLFPHLPRRSTAGFRIALGFGVVLVLVLGALRILPVALIAAAVLLPLLTLLYLREVDVYEDEPLRVVALTMLWGAVAGVALGLLTRTVTSTGAAYLSQSQGTTILAQGVLLPLLGLAVVLLGPLVLLRYRGFNDVLDGVTFGACAGAAFAGAEVITYGFSILSGGLRPGGAVAEWLGRLATIAVAIPVLEMAAIAAVAGAFWLRYRAPVRDRESLGVLGHPVAALAAAAVLLVVGFSLQTFMGTGWWLVCLVVLDGVALLWLRRVIHLGLLEEAAELPIGPPITCANCGASTPRHTFCINCGVSLQALPKQRPATAAGDATGAGRPSTDTGAGDTPGAPSASPGRPSGPTRPGLVGGRSAWRGGERPSRSGQVRIVAVFVALFMILAAPAVLFAALEAPAAPRSVCPLHRQCVNPPRKTGLPSFAALSAPLQIGGKVFVSSGLGYRIEFPAQFTVGSKTANGIELVSPNGAFIVLLQGVTAGQATPRQLMAQTLNALHSSIPDLQPDAASNVQILAPALAGRAGVGGFYQGNFDSPSGPVSPADVAVLAAGDGHQTIAVAAICANRSETTQFLEFVDQEMLDTLRFQADVAR